MIVIAAILAKRSERFPGKHMHRINNTTLIGEVVGRALASECFDKIVIFTKDPRVNDSRAEVVLDSTAGTAADSIAFLLKTYKEVFVLGGDMPLISPAYLRKMLGHYSGRPLFPIHKDGRMEPMHGIYNSGMSGVFEECRKPVRKSLQSLIESGEHDTIMIAEEEEKFFTNVNYRQDLENFENMAD